MGYYPYDTIENVAIAAFDDGAPVPVKQLELAITPVQTGTGDPAPDNVRSIYGFTKADISVNCVNQWDEVTEQGGLNWNTGAPVSSDNYIRSKNFCPIKAGMKVNLIKNDNTVAIFFYDVNKDFISRTGDNVATAPAGAMYFRLRIGDGTNPITSVSGVSVNYPDTETDYHKFTGEIITANFPVTAGTVYGGTLKYTGDGKYLLTVTHKLKVFDGTETPQSETPVVNPNGGYNAWFAYSQCGMSDCKMVVGDIPKKSNRFVYTPRRESQQNSIPIWSFSGNVQSTDGYISFAFDENYDTYEKILDWFSENNTQVWYEIATPQTYEITAEAVETLYKNNVIFANTGDIIKLEYRLNQLDYYRRLEMYNFGYIMMDGGGIDLSSSDPQSITGAWARTVEAIKTGKPIFAYNTKYGSGKNLTPVPCFAWYINSTTAVIVGATLHIQVTNDDTCVVQDVAPSVNRALVMGVDELAEKAVDVDELKTTKAKAKK